MNSGIRKTLISINATIISIIIASFAMYYTYQIQKYNEQIEFTIRSAERINDLRFIKSIYGPKEGSLIPSKNDKDLSIIFRYLLYIDILNVFAKNQVKPPDSMMSYNNYVIPDTHEEKGELILCYISIVTHSYPFAASHSRYGGSFLLNAKISAAREG